MGSMVRCATDNITWTNERRKLSQLIPWPRNPRQIKTDQAKRLVESFDQFGQVEPIAIGPGNELYNGHQRLNVLAAQHGRDYEVEVRVSSRPLSEKEREKLTVFLHKGAAGEWNFDTLANEFEAGELLEWGFSEADLFGKITSDVPEVNNDVNANTTKQGQYDKTKMPINVGALLVFMSEPEQQSFGENFSLFYSKEVVEDERVILLVKQSISRLADEISDLVSTD